MLTTKRLLIGVPILVIALMVQSIFWVPNQEKQAKANPNRLVKYFEGSIGDASILNPILSADGSSSDINSQVFEGLLDRDENLQFRGRIATSWKIYEEAYLIVDPSQSFPDGSPITAAKIQTRILKAKADAPSTSLLSKITQVKIIPPQNQKRSLPPEFFQLGLKEIEVDLPQRIQITLSQVEQDLFTPLTSLLGKNYFNNISTLKYFQIPEKDIPLKIQKELAENVLPAGEHNPIIVFDLRKDVTFHDGMPLTAKDVKFTYEAIMNEKNLSPRIPDYEPVKDLEILNPYQIKITYKRLYSPAIGTWGMGILPEHLLNENILAQEAKEKDQDPQEFSMRQTDFNLHPVGSGPFQFVDWKRDQYIHLKANPNYWEGKPNYEEFWYRIIPDPLGLEMEFYSGTLDGYGAKPYQVKRLQNDPDYQNFSGLAFGYTYIGYNLRRPLFQDKRVRKALGMAIDIDPIIRYIYYGHAERITGPFLKQTPYYNHQIKPLPYDLNGAQALLREAGWIKNSEGRLVHQETKKPFQFTLISNHGNDERNGVMIVAQQAWAKLGIEAKIQQVEWSVFIQKNVNKLDFDALVLGWSMGIDPDLYQIWHSSQTNPQQLNFVGFKNQEADDLIIRIRQEYNQEKMIQYSHRLHEIIAEEQPYTFLTAGRWTALLDKRIVRAIPSVDGFQYLPITPTMTGNFKFHFNQWLKVEKPDFH